MLGWNGDSKTTGLFYFNLAKGNISSEYKMVYNFTGSNQPSDLLGKWFSKGGKKIVFKIGQFSFLILNFEN